MRKSIQINSVINSGSTGRIAEEIGLKAIQNGWKSYIAYGRNDRPSKSHKIKIGNMLDILWHVLMTRLFDQHGLWSKRATKQLIKEIEKIQPDIIHLHNIHGYYLNYEILFEYLKTTNIPVVWTLHDCWAFTGHCGYFTFINCSRWKEQCYSCPQKESYPKSFYNRSLKNFELKKELFCSKASDMVLVPVSEWLNSVVKESFLGNIPIRTIYNGVDIYTFSFQESKLREELHLENKFVMLGVASIWDKRKGLDDYKKLSTLLAKDEVIVLVGLSKKQIAELPKNIIGIERTENISKLVDLYSMADIVFNLSYEETFGLTTVEGFACGTPGIVYNCTASPELVSKETGFVVEAGDFEELIIAIKAIKQNGKSFYTAACRERAIQHFNKEDRYAEYVELYEELLQKNQKN